MKKQSPTSYQIVTEAKFIALLGLLIQSKGKDWDPKSSNGGVWENLVTSSTQIPKPGEPGLLRRKLL